MVADTMHATPAPEESVRCPVVSPFTAPSLPHLASSPPPLDEVAAPTSSAPEASSKAAWTLRVPAGLAAAGGMPESEAARPGLARLSVLTPVPLGPSPSADAEDSVLMSEVTTPADSEVEGPWSSASSSPVDGLENVPDAPPEADAEEAAADGSSGVAAALEVAACRPCLDDDEAAAAAYDAEIQEVESAADDDDDEGLGEGTSAEQAVFALLALQGRSHYAVSSPAVAPPVTIASSNDDDDCNDAEGLALPPPPPTHITGHKRRADACTVFGAGGLLAAASSSSSARTARASPVPKPDSSGIEYKYTCKFDGCGKSYASTDAVRALPHCPRPSPCASLRLCRAGKLSGSGVLASSFRVRLASTSPVRPPVSCLCARAGPEALPAAAPRVAAQPRPRLPRPLLPLGARVSALANARATLLCPTVPSPCPTVEALDGAAGTCQDGAVVVVMARVVVAS